MKLKLSDALTKNTLVQWVLLPKDGKCMFNFIFWKPDNQFGNCNVVILIKKKSQVDKCSTHQKQSKLSFTITGVYTEKGGGNC